MKKMNICDFAELLDHAKTLGFHWNQAHDLLVKADLFVGHLTRDHYKDGCYCEPDQHVEARQILKSFMNLHRIEEVYITPKNYDC